MSVAQARVDGRGRSSMEKRLVPSLIRGGIEDNSVAGPRITLLITMPPIINRAADCPRSRASYGLATSLAVMRGPNARKPTTTAAWRVPSPDGANGSAPAASTTGSIAITAASGARIPKAIISK